VWCVTVRYRIVWDCCGQCDVLLYATELCRTAVGSVMCYCTLQNRVGLLCAVWCVTVRYRIVSDCDWLFSYFVGAFPKLWTLVSWRLSVLMSVRMEQLDSHWTDFHGVLYLRMSLQSVKKFTFHEYLTKITGTLHKDQYTFMIISRSILLRIGNFLRQNL